MSDIADSLGGLLGCLGYLLLGFPGGTIFMAIMVPSKDLGGLEWVLSVIIPGFGLVRGLIG
jgi:hypothetical protein